MFRPGCKVILPDGSVKKILDTERQAILIEDVGFVGCYTYTYGFIVKNIITRCLAFKQLSDDINILLRNKNNFEENLEEYTKMYGFQLIDTAFIYANEILDSMIPEKEKARYIDTNYDDYLSDETLTFLRSNLEHINQPLIHKTVLEIYYFFRQKII